MGLAKVKKIEELQVAELFCKHMVTEDDCVKSRLKKGKLCEEKGTLNTPFNRIVFEVLAGHQRGKVIQ